MTAGLGYGAGRSRLLIDGAAGSDAARVLSNAALYVFVPALLFRTTARIDYAHMPWRIIAAYFVPVLAMGSWSMSGITCATAPPRPPRSPQRARWRLRSATPCSSAFRWRQHCSE